MEKDLGLEKLLVLFLVVISIRYSEQLQSSQVKSLLRIRRLLNYPTALNSWNNDTDFCKIEPTSIVIVVCYEESITQLHIIGIKGASPLPRNFSVASFFTSLVNLPSLKVLRLVSLGLWGRLPGKLSRLSALEILDLSSNYFHSGIPKTISSLTDLQTLLLDGNRLTGRIPDGLGSLSVLAVLSLKNNSLDGPLPDTLRDMKNLRILSLSRNNFSGDVPDLSSLGNLQVLELEDNSFGPRFPQVGSKIESIGLRNNKFAASIPEKVQSYYQLEHFDISSNRFVGPFPPSLLSLPSITYLDVAGNKLTGMLFEDNPCNAALDFVNLSANLLTGTLPSCLLSSSRNRIVHFSNNCLATGDRTQHPFSFCRNEALAVGVLPHHQRQKPASKVVLALIICGSIIGGVILVCLTILIVKSFLAKKAAQKTQSRFISEDASSSYTSKLYTDARYITQAMKLGALSLPSYRTFSLEELEVATNNFDTATFMGEMSNGQMYRGEMRDGSNVTIRCLKMKRSTTTQNFMHHIELISKLRYCHLVSALGHCFECYLDDSSVSRIFLVFEYVPNGTLRSWISDRHGRRKLTWTQRIAAATGVAKGLQFLHNGIVPGIFSNNLKITDIMLDQNLVAKISSYNLPILSENVGKEYCHTFPAGYKEREKYEEKLDVYDFGVILLEIITGRQINTRNDILVLHNKLQVSIMGNEASRRNVVDPTVRSSCSDESLKTMIEICCRCFYEDPVGRPSMEDVLWNLQFAAQVQDERRDDSSSSNASPISPLQPSGQLVIQ
ncbi:putative inactive leucine-rich repeat receptor-like protein kinase At3g03770 isoform X2 [Nicotiana tabacum]|uniref:Inactive leucine-rich repeat receptor-like protein kinase At3g03770 isoform X2 n=2 Tax=Nicotiana tabacum TaxID=4097 RepID=A0AC58TSW1_TOBAC|nr:PREDICTED: probable inactive leucine-rich repeat receptor-like protein kinase At3g03770 [Nicotiana tabacum]XP_016476100.1 PREDICTED: probable inactive leucine-rich repeat receptor-like protein kinase At3g03770 [Nicotiana tabacum]